MEYINIDVSLVPYKFDISLNGSTFTFEVNYNTKGDFFTVGLSKDGQKIVNSEKVVFGKPLFSDISYRDVPSVEIVPMDKRCSMDRVEFNNFGKSVKLYLVGD